MPGANLPVITAVIDLPPSFDEPAVGNVYEDVEDEINIYEFVPDDADGYEFINISDEAAGRNHGQPANPPAAHGHGRDREGDFGIDSKI